MRAFTFGRAGRCSVRCIMMSAATANGSAMKKFQRQSIVSVMKPPRSGPPTVATAITAPNRPM